MALVPRVRLRKELARHLRAGHPWVWRDALLPAAHPAGTVVDVEDGAGRFVARGLFDPGSPIAVRVYTLDAGQAVDGGLVRERVQSALAARRGAFDPAATNAFRLLNGEGDLLPGLVVDLYADTAVARFDGAAARALLEPLVEATLAAARPLGVCRVYERSRGGRGAVLAGDEPPDQVEVLESGVRLAVDVKRGQKTGTFLDQRDNRRAIRPHASGVEVGNLFSYTGGFSLHAALAGARRVTSVDQAALALDGARTNFVLNGLEPERHGFECADVLDWLPEAARAGRRFGLLVVDPPSFAPSEKSLERALGAYRDLFASALALVEPKGVLAASSCSSHVDMEALLGALRDAGARARRSLRVLETRGQPADHPSTPAFREGRYLKFVLLRVD